MADRCAVFLARGLVRRSGACPDVDCRHVTCWRISGDPSQGHRGAPEKKINSSAQQRPDIGAAE